jgi:subtilisin family serine protease
VNFKVIALSGLLGLISACGPSQPTVREMLGGEEVGLFANRPENRTHFIAVVKLKSPPLMSLAMVKDGKAQVSAEAFEALKAEQAEALAALKEISGEIRVLYTYKMVLNGFAVVAPIAVADRIRASMHVAYVESESQFHRPITQRSEELFRVVSEKSDLTKNNSVTFIGSEAFYAQGFRGEGISVGVIDTGIDYTHSMFAGPGTKESFESIDPKQPSSLYPNSKIVGGIDLVGTKYNAASAKLVDRIPIPDLNPLDESGHGTHVAGSIAGIGDGVETYSGVAPEAVLHAIKVFGADGSTGDAVVIAALEYAADPNRDGKTDDQLDVVNLSLGSSFGSPHVLYSEAVRNLTRGGTSVVASAGNSGNVDFIVGSPSVMNEAFSVAASIDSTAHNWNFRAVKFNTAAGAIMAEAVEGPISLPIAEAGAVSGRLVFVGFADKDLSEEQISLVKGQVALIDRGIVPFVDKVRRAQAAGAVGVVVANNQPGEAFAMGGDGKFQIPAIMITKDLGDRLKGLMTAEAVTIEFQTEDSIEKPELIDTITDFSSKGPRSYDALIKPEITAPGSQIISADMGTGNKGVRLSGTSMSSPHVAGVMALVHQKHKSLSVAEKKSLVMGTAQPITDAQKAIYPISRQGAGRVHLELLSQAEVVANQAALSLGIQNISGTKIVPKTVLVKNLSSKDLILIAELEQAEGLKLVGRSTVSLKPGGQDQLRLRFEINAALATTALAEFDGWVLLKQGERTVYRMPVLALVKKTSEIELSDLKVQASSVATANGALATVRAKNASTFSGRVMLFNLLDQDQRKQNPLQDAFLSRECDLQSVGYRILSKTIPGVGTKDVLQIAAKTYEPVTNWALCELTVQIDGNGDGMTDQELAALPLGAISGAAGPATERTMVSALVDAVKMRELRRAYEAALAVDPSKAEEDYSTALIEVLPLTVLNSSTVLMVEADITKLAATPGGELRLKASMTHNESSVLEYDDFLNTDKESWRTISVEETAQPFYGMEEVITLGPQSQTELEMVKGFNAGSLLALFPDNLTLLSRTGQDLQSQVLSPLLVAGP